SAQHRGHRRRDRKMSGAVPKYQHPDRLLDVLERGILLVIEHVADLGPRVSREKRTGGAIVRRDHRESHGDLEDIGIRIIDTPAGIVAVCYREACRAGAGHLQGQEARRIRSGILTYNAHGRSWRKSKTWWSLSTDRGGGNQTNGSY